MEKAYSGLRRKRKRAHSTKCPCCYSSEEEPENHASSQKEKIKEGNQVIGKRTRRSKTVKSNEDGNDINKEVQKDNGILSEVAEGKKNETDSKKKAPKRTKQSGSKGKKVACPKQEHVDNAAEEKDLESQNKQTVRGTNKSSKTAVKKKDKTVKLSAPKHTVEENGNRNCIDGNKGSEALEKSSRAGVQSKVSKKSVDKKNSANDVTSLNKNNPEIKGKSLRKRNTGKAKTLVSSKNDGTLGLDQKGPKNENKVKNTSSGDSVSGSSSELASEKKSTSQNNRNLRRKKTPSSSESLSRKKVQVFDHLFAELKKCPGHSKATISSASELLLNLTSKELKSLIQGPGTKKLKGDMTGLRQSNDAHATSKTTMESKRKHSESEKSTIGVSVAHAIDINDNCVPSPRKIGSKKSEEAKLSQAAEALVSFRTNPSVMRQEKPEVDVQTATSLDENTAQRSLEQNPDDLLSTLLKGNQATETLMQIVSTSNEARLSQTNISSSVPPQSNLTSQLPSNLVFRGALSQPMNTPASLQQVTSAQQNIFTLSQLRSQMSAALTVPSPIQPGVTLASSVSGPSAVMSTGMIRNAGGVQNLQALFCTPPQPPSFQISTTSQPPTTCHVPGSTQQRAPLPQPLKGMEDVVSCVGSHSTALLWNIKPAPPVVYITSPQTLGGVRARNIFPNEGQGVLPFAASPAKVPSGNLQNVDSMSILGKLNRGSQPTPLSISHTASIPSQRPILPREQKVPSSFPNGLSNASQLPIAQVAGQIPGNIQPLATGSMSGGISVTSALNRQPSTTVAMQLTGVATSQSALSNTVAAMPVSAKQAVKRFVHERTKSAELKRTESFGNLPSTFDALNVPVTSSEKAENFGSALHQPLDRMEQAYASKASEFNLQQAASALLSISSQDGLDAGDVLLPAGEGDDSPEEPDDEVVFTSKGVFRVGDVDVDPKYNSIGREGYTCGKCGKIFTSLSYLARHIKRVCPDMSCRKWKCTMCDKAFRHPFGLQQHIYTHTGERPHKCSQCPKAFYSSNDLRRHSRIHSGERPYHCKHCEKSFATTISLKTHTYIHTGEKPHKCPHCPKTFATSSKLGRHIVTHSEQRPFTCNLCPKSFNRSGDLRRHNMHVHEPRDKPFEWDDCNGPFVTPDCLEMHMGNHDDRGDNQAKDRETPLQCPLCSATCDSSHRLEHHMLTHDPAIVSSHGKFNQRVDDLPGGTVSLSTDGN